MSIIQMLRIFLGAQKFLEAITQHLEKLDILEVLDKFMM